jgi:hypothetical protein
MSDNMEALIDLPFIRKLAANPERTSRQIEQIFSNTLNQTENNYQIEQLQSLRDLWQTNKEISRWLSEVLLSNQRGYDDFSHSIENFSEDVSDVMVDLNSNIWWLSGALESIYWWQLPEWKSMIEIWKMLSFNGKRTVIALAAHWWMSSYQLSQIFHPDLIEYLNNGYSSWAVSRIQQRNIGKIYEMQQQQADLIEKKKLLDVNTQDSSVWIDSKFSDLKREIAETKRHLLSWEEIKLLDFALIAKRKKIPELISDWIIDQKVLGFLMRNQKIEWNMALNISRMVMKNEEWQIKPLIELEGIMGIMQETRINRKIGNKGIVQREETNKNLESIDESIVDGFDTINENLWKKLDTVKWYLSDVDNSISSGFNNANNNLTKLNDSLYEIWSFNYGIKIPKEWINLIDLIKNFWPDGKKTVLSLYAKWMLEGVSKDTLKKIFSADFADLVMNEWEKKIEKDIKGWDMLISDQDFTILEYLQRIPIQEY